MFSQSNAPVVIASPSQAGVAIHSEPADIAAMCLTASLAIKTTLNTFQGEALGIPLTLWEHSLETAG